MFETNKDGLDFHIAHQKKVADKIIDKLFLIDPYAICAGGAPRDWYFGNAAKDIDIFIHSTHTMGTTEEMLKRVGLSPTSYSDSENLPEWYKMNPELHCVFNLTVDGENVQIMLMYKPTFQSVVPNFPFSICKVWYKNGKIVFDKEFARSVKHKVIVKTGELYSNQHRYVQKIRDKFKTPDWVHFDGWPRALEYIVDYKVK